MLQSAAMLQRRLLHRFARLALHQHGAHHHLIPLSDLVILNEVLEVPGRVAGPAAGGGLRQPDLILRPEDLSESHLTRHPIIPGLAGAPFGVVEDQAQGKITVMLELPLVPLDRVGRIDPVARRRTLDPLRLVLAAGLSALEMDGTRSGLVDVAGPEQPDPATTE